MDFSALQGVIPDSWILYITGLVTVCAAVVVVLPPPAENSGVVYRAVYNAVQWIALNLGKAKNAEQQKTVPSDGKR